MEYREYANPEEKDYDLRVEEMFEENSSKNPNQETLIELLGLREDINEEQLLERFGITLEEYLNPTDEVIKKVQEKLGIRQK